MINKTLNWDLTQDENLLLKKKEELISKMEQLLDITKKMKKKEKADKGKVKKAKKAKEKKKAKKIKKAKKSKSKLMRFLKKNAGSIIAGFTLVVAIAFFGIYKSLINYSICLFWEKIS